jgi:predicted nucleic acid-binding protein
MAAPSSAEIIRVIVVADASPLNYLILIEEIDLLPKLFGRVLVPAGVVAELQDPSAPSQVTQWIANRPGWLEVRESPEIRKEITYLDRGESEAISLALALNIPKLLIDDFAGRQAAKFLSLEVTGTLGLLKLAAQAGYLDEVSALRKLMGTNFRLSRSMRDALAQRNNPI